MPQVTTFLSAIEKFWEEKTWVLWKVSWASASCTALHPSSASTRQNTSVAVLAVIPLRSPRRLFIFIIKRYIYRIKVFEKKIILKKTSLQNTSANWFISKIYRFSGHQHRAPLYIRINEAEYIRKLADIQDIQDIHHPQSLALSPKVSYI